MDYKEKYEQALEYMRTVYPTLNGATKEDVEHYFPELIENKDEENIREAIIALIEFGLEDKSAIAPGYNVTKEQSIAWLEKQDPKKHEDELEKAYKTADEVQYRKDYEDAKREFEKQGEQKPQGKRALEVWKDMRLEVYQQASGNRHEPNYSDDSTKMFSLTDIDEIFEKVAEKQCEQKTTNKIKPRFKVGDTIRYKNSGAVFTIKSVYSDHYSLTNNEGLLYFIFQDKYALVEQKPAWSEEDESTLDSLIKHFDWVSDYRFDKNDCDEAQNRLKSLKERYTWKPSDEQIEVLNWCKPLWNEPKTKAVLESLIEDLKKLKGE